MKSLPNWFPTDIAERVRDILKMAEEQNSAVSGDIDLFLRLVSDERMRTVWTRLSKRGANEDTLWDLLMQAWSAPNVWTHSYDVVQSSSVLEQVATTSQKLADLLERAPIPIGEIRNNILKLASKAMEKTGDPYAIKRFQEAVEPFLTNPEVGVYTPSLSSILREVSEYALKQKANYRYSLPRKAKSPTAQRTYLMKTFSKFMKDSFGTPLYEVVAILVAVVLDIEDDIDPEHVRKVVS